MSFQIPKEVLNITQTLQKAGFEAWLVGGCVRDLLINRKPKDWDITTNALPEDIQKLFPKTFYENDFGTVGVVNEPIDGKEIDGTLKVVEVTPFRKEGKYSDFRRPDEVSFEANLEDDLKRRDFTINTLAYNPTGDKLVDLFEGQKDLKGQILRAVGNPKERFQEDALRMLRAVRLASELSFAIESETSKAIEKEGELLKNISAERIQIEFSRIIMSDNPMAGIIFCQRFGLLKYFLPEIEEGLGTEQNGDHIYDVWEHNLRALNHAAGNGWSLHVRLSALLHDVGKPRTRRWGEEQKDWTFYGHDVVGSRMAEKILKRLKYSNDITDVVSRLVRHHMFFSDIEKITLSAVRRIVRNVGEQNVWDLMKVRACDRIGMGRPKETPYRLRKYHSMIEEAMRAPVSVGMLKINGAKIMQVAKLSPGPKIGFILHALLEEALDNPEINDEEQLQEKAVALAKLTDDELKKLGQAGKEKKEQKEEAELAEIRGKYGVK